MGEIACIRSATRVCSSSLNSACVAGDYMSRTRLYEKSPSSPRRKTRPAGRGVSAHAGRVGSLACDWLVRRVLLRDVLLHYGQIAPHEALMTTGSILRGERTRSEQNVDFA